MTPAVPFEAEKQKLASSITKECNSRKVNNTADTNLLTYLLNTGIAVQPNSSSARHGAPARAACCVHIRGHVLVRRRTCVHGSLQREPLPGRDRQGGAGETCATRPLEAVLASSAEPVVATCGRMHTAPVVAALVGRPSHQRTRLDGLVESAAVESVICAHMHV